MNTEGRIKTTELSPHPQNNYYFDDVEGDTWDSLLQSITTSGITNAITITQNKRIISGHQRVRACKVLGIETVSYKMIEYDDESKEIKDLIESNLRQRVVGNPNPIKLGRCFIFLNEYYGIEHGGDRKSSELKVHLKNPDDPKTQKELAERYDTTQQGMNKLMRLAKAIPELQELIKTETVTQTTALAIMKNLPPQEQEELISNLDITKKYTQKQIQEFIDENNKLQNRISELQNQPPKIVDNTDYTTIKSKENEIQRLKEEFKLKNEKMLLLEKKSMVYEQNSKEYEKLTKQLESLSKQKDDLSRQITAITSISGLVIEIENMLSNKLAPVKYSRAITEASQDEIVVENLTQIINSVQQWCDEMKGYLPKENIEFIEAEEIIE